MVNTEVNVSEGSKYFLSKILIKGANNFDILRLIASLAVIVGHAYAIAPQPSMQDGVLSLLHFDYSGSLAVKFFFFLSGLLVTNSIILKPEAFSFFTKRAFRIFPGFFVCLVVAVFIIGPSFSSLSVFKYFSLRETWTYLPKNFLLSDMQWRLPGVFTNSKYGLNGSLWTLPYEVLCYIFLAIFYGLGLLKNRWIANVFFVAIILVSFAAPNYLPGIFSQNTDSFLLPGCFAIGAIFANNKDSIRINISILVLLWLLSILLHNSVLYQFIFYIAFFYSCIFIASTKFVINKFKLPFDASYGIYVYGFMFQQCVFYLLSGIGVHGNQIITSILALIAGILSWYFVEKPFINLGHRIAKLKSTDLLKINSSNIAGLEYFLFLKIKFYKYNNTITFLILTILAFFSHVIVLKFIFPGFYSPLYPQHSDFYIPATLANSPDITYFNLLSWPRSISFIFSKFIGNLGVKGSIACVIFIVCINISLGALLIKRIFNLTLNYMLLTTFIIYCYFIFSHPYFYIFYAQDIGAQLSYLILIIGAHLFYCLFKNYFVLANILLLICCVLAFLSKETYGPSALVFAFLWFIYNRKNNLLKSIVPFLTIIFSLILIVIINLLIKPAFVDIKATADSSYFISFNPLVIFKEWLKYLFESLNFAIAAIILLVGYGLTFNKNKNKNKLIFFAVGCLLGTLISWLPNALLPNHHFKGYSFNGAYLLFLPLLTLPLIHLEYKINKLGLFLIIGLSFLSYFFNISKYKGNEWVLIQENTQRNLMRDLVPLMDSISNSTTSTKILIKGITFPFHPFGFPQSLRVYPNAKYATFDVVNYNLTPFDTSRKDLVKFIDSATASKIKYDKIWEFDNDGNLLKQPSVSKELLKAPIITSSSKNKSLKIGLENFSKFKSSGFYDNENGLRWTNGAALIVLDSTISNADNLILRLNTYMPPKCIKIVPRVFLTDINNQNHEAKLMNRKDNIFSYALTLNKKDTLRAVNILSPLIDASPDQRTLSFPFISLSIDHY